MPEAPIEAAPAKPPIVKIPRSGKFDHDASDPGKSRSSIDFGPLKRLNWADTPLGDMNTWQPCLKSLASLLVTLPYATAIFWGNDLVMLHNSAWSAIRGNICGQGKLAKEMLSDDAIGRLKATMRGQVHNTHSENFFSQDDSEIPRMRMTLHPLCGDGGGIEGVMVQFGRLSDKKSHTKAQGENEMRESESIANARIRPEQMINWLQEGTDGRKHSASTDGSGENDPSRLFQHLPIDGRVLFQKFAHMIPTGLAILDSNAEALFVNDLFYKLTTHSGTAPFRAWPQSIHPDDYDRVMKDYKNAFNTDQVLSTQFRSVCGDPKNPSASWRLFMMRAISDTAPSADGYLCAVIDITSLKSAELYQRRVATEAIERKQQQEKFMDMISHEIRNPLSAILHCSEGILDSIKGSPEGEDSVDIQGNHTRNHLVDKECLDEIVEAAETILFCVAHQKNIVDDILSFSKLDAMMLSLTPAAFQPDQKFAQYLRIFQSELREKVIELKFAIDPSFTEIGLNWVLADMVRINQVLVNLMTNAIKFTARRDGERNITVSIGASRKRPTSYPPSVVFFKDEDAVHRMDATLGPEWGEGQAMWLLVAVRDNGIGMSDADQERLFERFRQATPRTQEQYGGSGLGLFISRKLCQLHGGDIGVSSKAGIGSTFGFFFKVRKIDKPKQDKIDKHDSELRESTLMPQGLPVDERTPKSLIHPVTEPRQEVHPSKSKDDRYETTAQIAARVEMRAGQEQEIDEPEKAAVEKNTWESQGDSTRPSEFLSSRSKSNRDKLLQERELLIGSDHDEEDRRHDQQLQSDTSQVDKVPGLSSRTAHSAQISEKSISPANDHAEFPGKLQVKSPEAEGTGPKHILLVEDNLINQRVLKRHLQTKGFRVSVANNGQEAVEAHLSRLDELNRASDQDRGSSGESSGLGMFECILMDQEMPVMDGNTATKTIRKNEDSRRGSLQGGRVPVLGISANARDAQRQGMFDAGMDDVVSKPFAMADLVKKIHETIEKVQHA